MVRVNHVVYSLPPTRPTAGWLASVIAERSTHTSNFPSGLRHRPTTHIFISHHDLVLPLPCPEVGCDLSQSVALIIRWHSFAARRNLLSRTLHRCLGHRSFGLAHGVSTRLKNPTDPRRHRYAGKSIPSRIASLPAKTAPGVTIIRPLCGLDNNLYNALEAAMKLDYPKYQVLFALQDEEDEALPVVRMIMDKYPNVDAKVIIGESRHRTQLNRQTTGVSESIQR